MKITYAVFAAMIVAALVACTFPANAFVLSKDGRQIVRAHSVSGNHCRIDEIGSHFYIRGNCKFR